MSTNTEERSDERTLDQDILEALQPGQYEEYILAMARIAATRPELMLNYHGAKLHPTKALCGELMRRLGISQVGAYDVSPMDVRMPSGNVITVMKAVGTFRWRDTEISEIGECSVAEKLAQGNNEDRAAGEAMKMAATRLFNRAIKRLTGLDGITFDDYARAGGDLSAVQKVGGGSRKGDNGGNQGGRNGGGNPAWAAKSFLFDVNNGKVDGLGSDDLREVTVHVCGEDKRIVDMSDDEKIAVRRTLEAHRDGHGQAADSGGEQKFDFNAAHASISALCGALGIDADERARITEQANGGPIRGKSASPRTLVAVYRTLHTRLREHVAREAGSLNADLNELLGGVALEPKTPVEVLAKAATALAEMLGQPPDNAPASGVGDDDLPF